ncbi:MAG: glycosyltransferase family 4 protein [Deltaproteobacteria bacterium]|nr:glycosyltransferase family 4 protein [Deltaproteobacteria bacterium]
MPKTILMVSKPVVPPWNDSAKNLVRDVVRASRRHSYRVLVTRGSPFDGERERVTSAEIYGDAGAYTPGLAQNARVLAHLALGPRADVVHYFFAPNPRTSTIARFVGVVRRRPSIQTVCSAPRDFTDARRILFADLVVVLSEQTRRRFVEAGIDEGRVRLIRPCIFPFSPPDPRDRAAARARFAGTDDRPVILFAGDYQFSTAAETVARAVASVVAERPARFVFACRIKQEASRLEQRRIEELLAASGVLDHVRFWNEVDDMPSLLGATDLIVMPAESLYAKMDVPLVLLEAMSLGVPIVVSDVPPLSELHSPEIGAAVPPGDPAALARAVLDILGDPGRLRAMGEAARSVVRERFSPDVVARAYENLYDEVA